MGESVAEGDAVTDRDKDTSRVVVLEGLDVREVDRLMLGERVRDGDEVTLLEGDRDSVTVWVTDRSAVRDEEFLVGETSTVGVRT